jgi:hypothetical protein
VAYPTDPSQVGLTVAKGTLTLDTRTSITANETVTERYFPNGIRVSNNAVVSFTNCWFYGGGTHSLRVSASTVTVTNCEFGITLAEGWDEDTHVVSIQLWNDGAGGTFNVSESYFHHGGDAIRLAANDVVHRCYVHDLVLADGDHADAVQCIGGSDWSITDSYIDCNNSGYLPGAVTPNRAIQVGASAGAVTGYKITANYMDSEGFYTLGIGEDASGTVVSNRFGRAATAGAIYNLTFPSTVVHYDNRYADDLTLVEGENEVPAAYTDIDVRNIDAVTPSTITFTLPAGAAAGAVNGGVLQANISPFTFATTSKIAFAYKENNFAASVNGVTPILDTSGTLPTVDRLNFMYNNTAYGTGIVKSLRYWPQRLTNNEVQAFSK